MMPDPRDCPRNVLDFAGQAVEYVRRAIGVTLEFDSETLPVLDHYVRQVPHDQPGARELVMATCGAYYGEVVRLKLGGSWHAEGAPDSWQLTLPGGLAFTPAGFVAAAMVLEEVDDCDAGFTVPDGMRPFVESALEQMAPVTAEEYYSLCGRLDTLEHIMDCLFARAEQELQRQRRAAGDEPPN